MKRRPGGPADLSRRAWLRFMAAGATGLALGCGDNDGGEIAAAVLEPTSTSFVIALWSQRGGTVLVEVRADDELIATLPVELGPGGLGALPLDDLAPDRAHEIVIITAAGSRSGPYHARTAPLADDLRPVRIAVSADFDPSPEFDSELVDHLLAAGPELYVSLGDFPYTDNGRPSFSLDDYRARHRELRTAPAARRLFEGVGVRAIYDDHEVSNDWDGEFVATEAARYADAMQAWDEFFPVRDAVGEIRYRSWRWGAHAECFLLDVRRFRSPNNAPDDAAKHMLGPVQRAWLVDGILRSTATFKLVFTAVPLDFANGPDHWAAFTTEREQLFEALVGTPGVLFVSADQHYFAAHRHAYGIREFQVGPFARGLGVLGPVRPGVLFRSRQQNVGLIEIASDRLIVIGLGEDGQRFYTEELTPEALTPRAG